MFVLLATTSGFGFYNIAVMLEALTSERGFSVSAVSATTAFFFVVSGISGLYIARLVERFDPRWTICIGALLGALGLLLVGRAEEVWQLYASYGVFGVGFSATSLLPGTTLVTRWFVRRRSIALSIATTGLSVGGITLTPLSARWIDSQGLMQASVWMAGGFVVGIVPIALLLVRPSPETMGLEPDGEDRGQSESRPQGPNILFASAVRSRLFVAVTGCYVFAMLAQVGAIAHQFKFVSDELGPASATLAVSVLAGASVVGRLGGGWVVSFVPLRTFALIMLACQSGALLAFPLASGELGFLLASGALGLTVGNLLMLQPLLLAEGFGVLDYPRIYSFGSLITTVGVAAGPVLLGLLHGLNGDYRLPFVVAAVVSTVALAWMAIVGSAEPTPNET